MVPEKVDLGGHSGTKSHWRLDGFKPLSKYNGIFLNLDKND